MRGLEWTAAIWAVTLIVSAPGGPRAVFRTGRLGLTRGQWAVVLVLLGSHSFAATVSAEEVLANPLVIERAIRGALSGMALALAIPALFRHRSVFRSGRFPTLAALTLYVLIAATSVLYSVAQVVTLGKAIELGAAVAAVWLVTLETRGGALLVRTIRLLVLLEASLLAVAVIGFFTLPSVFYSGDTRPGFIAVATMGAPYGAPNGLSASGALVFAYALAQTFESSPGRARRLWASLAIVGTLAVVLSSGRQGVAIWLASSAVLLWIYRRTLLLILVAPMTALVLWLNWDSLWETLTRSQAQVNVTTWSGRFTMWDAALEALTEHPWTGFGFGAGGRWVALERIGADTISSLHNGYLEALLGVGLLGTLVLLAVAVRVTVWSVQSMRRRSLVPVAILIVPLLLRTFVSLGFGGWVNTELVLFACLAALTDRQSQKRLASTAA